MVGNQMKGVEVGGPGVLSARPEIVFLPDRGGRRLTGTEGWIAEFRTEGFALFKVYGPADCADGITRLVLE